MAWRPWFMMICGGPETRHGPRGSGSFTHGRLTEGAYHQTQASGASRGRRRAARPAAPLHRLHRRVTTVVVPIRRTPLADKVLSDAASNAGGTLPEILLEISRAAGDLLVLIRLQEVSLMGCDELVTLPDVSNLAEDLPQPHSLLVARAPPGRAGLALRLLRHAARGAASHRGGVSIGVYRED